MFINTVNIMAKLSSASIRLVQKMNRQNKNLEFPIYIVVCFHGRVEKACGVSCLQKDWDSKREIVKRSCSNSVVLNKMLYDIKNRVIQRKNDFEFHGKVYTANMLLEDYRIDYNGNSNVFRDVMNRLCNERRLKDKTKYSYIYCHRKLSEYCGKDDFLVDEVNLSFVKGFLSWCDVSDETKRGICGSIASVWNYAISKDLVDSKDYPFKEWKFTQKLKPKGRDYFLDKSHIKKLMDYWLDLVVDRDGNRWSYKDGAWEKLGNRNSKEFGILWFLLMYKLNGSAPIEITKLKLSDCRRISINGEDYWAIDFKRQKSGTSVQVRWKRDMFAVIGLEHFMGRSTNGYVYPIIMDADCEDYKMLKDSWHCSESAIKWVRKAFEEINQKTIEKNVMEGSNEPLVECERVVMYTARHSFACHYLNSEGSTVAGLATLMARSPNTIAQYVHQLTNDEEIASMVDSMVI